MVKKKDIPEPDAWRKKGWVASDFIIHAKPVPKEILDLYTKK